MICILREQTRDGRILISVEFLYFYEEKNIGDFLKYYPSFLIYIYIEMKKLSFQLFQICINAATAPNPLILQTTNKK